MSFMFAQPDVLSAAASDLAALGSSIDAAHAAAAFPTTSVVAAAGDEISAAIASVFSGFAQDYQTLSARAAGVHAQFVAALTGSGAAYSATEAASTSPLRAAQSQIAAATSVSPAQAVNAAAAIINAPTEIAFGQPLVGNGANGTAASPNGQPGGFLFGNGGNGYNSSTAGVAGGNGGALSSGGYDAFIRATVPRRMAPRVRRWIVRWWV